MRKILIALLIGLFLLCSFSAVSAEEKITKNGVTIDPFEKESESLYSGDKGEKVNVEVDSDIPINVYIMTQEDYFKIPEPAYDNAKVSKEGITTTSFSYTFPDDQNYYLVMYNPNNETATVDYEYTDLFAEDVGEASEEVFRLMGLGILLCVGIIVIVIVVIVVIIVLLTRKNKDERPPQYPQHPGYVPPPPPGQQPPPRY